jgi:hypothetical protein
MVGNVRESQTFCLQTKQKDQICRWALRNSLSSRIGRGKYAMSEYQKIKRITFPLEEDYLLLVTTEVDADHDKIITEILVMIK